MEFCQACDRYMNKRVREDGRIVFICQTCHCERDGSPTDSLWSSHISTREDLRDEMIIERSGHDPAAKIVIRDCPNCPNGRRYMTRIRKADATIVYVCGACGKRINGASASEGEQT